MNKIRNVLMDTIGVVLVGTAWLITLAAALAIWLLPYVLVVLLVLVLAT